LQVVEVVGVVIMEVELELVDIYVFLLSLCVDLLL
tara:strand:+ start:67 stop:171 length:105 start_codon:yes stop_codon:yes gene_type:complete